MAAESTSEWPSDPSQYAWKGTFKQAKSAWTVLAYCNTKKQDVFIEIRQVESEENFSNRIHDLLDLKHPNLMTPLHHFHHDDQIWIIFRHILGGPLSKMLSSHFPDGIHDVKVVATLLFHILNGIHYLHQNEMNHRRICPEYILFDTELGLTILKHKVKPKKNGHELDTRDPLLLMADPKATWFHGDVFSVGITALYLVHGVPPEEYDQSLLQETRCVECESRWYEEIVSQMYPQELTVSSVSLEDFVVQCTSGIDHRDSVEHLLEHAFFRSSNLYSTTALKERIGHLVQNEEINPNLSEPLFFWDLCEANNQNGNETQNDATSTIVTEEGRDIVMERRRAISYLVIGIVVGILAIVIGEAMSMWDQNYTQELDGEIRSFISELEESELNFCGARCLDHEIRD